MIKKFKEFESISGTELVGHMGPNWGDEKNSPPIKSGMTDLIYSPVLGRIISFGEYQELYGEYLKVGGNPLHGFNKENLQIVIDKLQLKESITENFRKEVEIFCRKFRINGELDEFGKLNVRGSVDLSRRWRSSSPFHRIPYKLGSVTSEFNCANNDLTDLINSPDTVGGWFDCRVNKLKSLNGSPKEVESFYCNYNQLTNLVGGPEIVKSSFDCSNNELTSFEGFPKSIGQDFSFNNNHIRDFKGIPEFALPDGCRITGRNNPVWEIYQLFNDPRCIDLINEYEVIRDGDKVVIDRLLEVYSTLDLPIPDEMSFKFKNYKII